MLILVPTRCSIAQAICPYTSTCRLLHSWHSMETNERLVILTIILCSYFTYEKTEIQQVTCHRSHRRQGTDFVNQNLLTPNSCFITSVHAKSFQLCLTLCGPMDCRSSQCFSVHGILQASILECIAISPSKRSSQPRTNFSSVVCCSVPQSCLILWDCMDCSMPGLPVLHQLQSLLKLVSMEWMMPSNHLVLCHTLLLLPSIFPSIKVFSNESALHIRWPKYRSFSFGISPSISSTCP